ncbi:hypothetical protein [Atlantibacter sp.]|uniref:hypothetical protein n=1 Tax=Atlantibacter sp. TaxID=1903473 RepID=UPI0028A5A896|nr:hypothetical protein [Atlantibacter sp.]
MTVSKEEFEKLKARTSVAEVALAYTIANLSAKFPDIKPAVINALKNDVANNEASNPAVAIALTELADLIAKFSFTEKQ